MASHNPDFGRASALPLSAVLGAIPSYPRPVIEQLVAKLIDHLDVEDGDLDLEPNGDELDGTCAEDEDKAGLYAPPFSGPGCPFSDVDCGIDDLPHDRDADAEPDEGLIPALGVYGIDQRKPNYALI